MKCILPLLLAASAAGVGFSADEAVYNMPESKTASTAQTALDRMEKAVAPEVLAAFKSANPSPYWLFGEDRAQSVRSRVVPAHWFEKDAKNLNRFYGKAQPGEYYVFQIAVLNGENQTALTKPEVKGALFPVTCLSLEQTLSEGHPQQLSQMLNPGQLKPLWFGVEIPENAKGTISFQLLFDGKPFTVTLEISGAVLKDGGIHDGWRLARLKWLNSTIAHSTSEVTAPFTPIESQKNGEFSILGRTISLDKTGLPKSYLSFFNASNTAILPKGKEAFVTPPEFTIAQSTWVPDSFTQTVMPVLATWQAKSHSQDGALTLTVDGKLEYDGFMQLNMTVTANRDTAFDSAALTFTLAPEASRYNMGMGLKGGNAIARHEWSWNVSKHQDAFWMGDVNQGLMIRLKGANYERPLINAYYDFKPLNLPESWGGGGMTMARAETGTALSFHSGKITLKAGEKQHFNTDWYLTPFKPIDPGTHLTDRYYHAPQGRGLENMADLKKYGVNQINIHHNRVSNPFINYPYSDLSIQRLKDHVKLAHEHDIKLKVYYTTREITQNLPEFFAFDSLEGEVILPRKAGVAWPVTNKKGPHPWLTQHLGDNFVPAWRETIKFPEYKGMLDLAVITTPDSRLNNFYLEGLNFLVDEVGIDGLYIDDTALDRKSMQRARRILDKDGPGKRKVDMHSWSHYNGLAKWANSDICFMELYPYFDRLWHGEGGTFNANNAALDYMLVEMSGICYGLMSEMLDAPNNWKGLVFGMTRRWPWSGDPRPVWKQLDAFGIEPGIEMIGWWDPAVPVKSSSPDVPVTVYKKPGKAMFALANWDGKLQEITLAIDWVALGFDPAKTTMTIPDMSGLQKGFTFKKDAPIPVLSKGGCLIILEETK